VTPLLQTIELCCERDERRLIEKLNLSVEPAHIYQIEGPNGSGKTTLLRVLCGLSSHYEGQIRWQGELVSKVRESYLSQLLYIGHSSGVKAVLTPRENLQWHAAVKGCKNGDAHQSIEYALDRVGLFGYEDVPCFTLSAGQQRRVGLARLFLSPCRLWVLDEPFTAIDKQGVAELESWISEFAGDGGSVILTTHHELKIDHRIERIRLGI
jgi:heme exporter protein A